MWSQTKEQLLWHKEDFITRIRALRAHNADCSQFTVPLLKMHCHNVSSYTSVTCLARPSKCPTRAGSGPQLLLRVCRTHSHWHEVRGKPHVNTKHVLATLMWQPVEGRVFISPVVITPQTGLRLSASPESQTTPNHRPQVTQHPLSPFEGHAAYWPSAP